MLRAREGRRADGKPEFAGARSTACENRIRELKYDFAAGSYYPKDFGTAKVALAMVKLAYKPTRWATRILTFGAPGVPGLRVRVWIEPSGPVSLIGFILKRANSLRKNNMLLLVFF